MPTEEDLAFMQPTAQEEAQRREALERVGLLGSFRFWATIYVVAFIAIFLLF